MNFEKPQPHQDHGQSRHLGVYAHFMSNILHTTTSDFCQRSLARGDNVDKVIIICVGSGADKRVLVN